MIEYKNSPNNNIAEISVAGKITEADFDRVSSQMKADIQKHGKLRLLETFHSFEGIDPITLWKDAKFGLDHLDNLTHIAVVAEQTWMQTIAGAVDNLLSAKVKAFDSSQIEQAREWLLNAPESSQDSKLEYRNNPDNNIIELSVEGKVTEADFDRVIDQVKADIEKHGKVRLLEEVRNFEGMDPMALWKDVKSGIPLIKDITHVAVVADAKWMRTLSEAFKSVLPAQLKAFELSEIEAAREWLANAPESNHESKLEYRHNPDNNIVEITIEGKITEADFDRLIPQAQADFKKHGKLRILEEVGNFEGIDPMALWKDLKFGLPHLNDITHVAVVTDTKWMRTYSTAVDSVLSAEVKSFERSQIEVAREWLASA